MKAIVLTVCMIVVSLSLKAQGTMRPVFDSTATCSYYKGMYDFSENAAQAKQILEVFYIVEEMPKLITPNRDIEDILKKDIQMNEQEMTYLGDFYLQCVVNCKGIAGDFQIISCPSDIVNISCQVSDIFKDKLKKWEPGRQRGRKVDVLVKIKVQVSNGIFSVVAPVI